MKTNYLSLSNDSSLSGLINYCTTNNFDELYEELIPNISKKNIWERSISYSDKFLKNTSLKIKEKFKLNQVVLGAGSEELIIRLRVLALENNWRVCITSPFFYRTEEILRNAKPQLISEDSLDFDFSKFDLVIFFNPNPLNGHLFKANQLLSLFKQYPKTTFIIDEASMFILPSWKDYSLTSYTDDLKNFVVFSSFSKMYGIPLQRVGFASGNKHFLNQLRDVGPTFPVSPIALLLAENLLQEDQFLDILRDKIQKNKKELKEIITLIPELKIINDSPINCIYLQSTNSKNKLYKELMRNGILSLDVEKMTLKPNSVRLTIHSSKSRHQSLMNKFKQIANQNRN